MKPATIYTVEDAPESAATILRDTQNALGFVPNLFGVLAASPYALTAFASLNAQFSESSFSATEREVIQLTVSAENRCGYCVAGHTAFAAMQDVDATVVEALRNGGRIPDQRLEALKRFTQDLIRRQGMVTEAEVERFLDAGYTHQQLLEVILGICVKVFSNIANNAIGIPLDDAFVPYEWDATLSQTRSIQQQAA